MRLGGLIAATIEILNAFFKKDKSIAILLKEWAAKHRFAGSSDRHHLANIIYDILRSYYSFSIIAQSDKIAARVFISLLCGEYSLSYQELYQEVTQNKYALGYLPYLEVFKNIENHAIELDNAYLALANILPWQVKHFKAAFGSEWVQEAAAFSARPPIDIRLNKLKKSNIGADFNIICDILPQALRLMPSTRFKRKQHLTSLMEYKQGHFEIQDFGSQLVAKLVDAKANMQILDYCAGAGGKSLALAADMQNKGQIFAYDKFKHRLSPIYERIKRSAATIIKPVNNLTELVAKMDIVLVDAPCSGSGTWRRFPDKKFLLKEQDLEPIIEQQLNILTKASSYVKPGGYLCYITCSIFNVENDEQIERFLLKHPSFQLDTSKRAQSPYNSYFINYGRLFTPWKSSSDGFYFACVRKAGL